MRKRFISVALMVASLAVFIQPADAGPYRTSFGVAQAAAIAGRVKGGFAFAYIARLEGAAVDGELTVLPAPAAPEPPNGIKASYIGCIEVFTSKGRDGGCKLMPPSTVDFDPMLTKGTVLFAVKSRFDGKRVVATLLLNGAGEAPAPAPADCMDFSGKPCSRANTTLDTDPRRIEPGRITSITIPGQTAPAWLHEAGIDAQQVLARDMTVIGSIKSELVGGGALRSTNMAIAYSGLNGFVWQETGCLARSGTCRT